VVTITTPSGLLFLKTEGTDCPNTGTDVGTWVVLGGTGLFKGSMGSGGVSTQATGGTGTPTDPIRSASVYTGSITLK
jgi:hypothetical protein